MPKISIIVPIYKAEAVLAKCVDSVLAQTCSDWELLLIDGGDTAVRSHTEMPFDSLLGCDLRLCRNGNNFWRAFSHTVSLLPII